MRQFKLAKGTPYVKTSVMVPGQDQIDAFEALCHVNGRKPHQLAADIVLDYIREHRHDPGVPDLVRMAREFRAQHAERPTTRLRLVK